MNREATIDLIRDVSGLVDDRALAAFDVDTPETPDDGPDGILSAGVDGVDAIRRMLVGTDLDADGLEHYVGYSTRRTVEAVATCGPTLTAVVIAGFIRAAFLTGYHAHAEQARRDA